MHKVHKTLSILSPEADSSLQDAAYDRSLHRLPRKQMGTCTGVPSTEKATSTQMMPFTGTHGGAAYVGQARQKPATSCAQRRLPPRPHSLHLERVAVRRPLPLHLAVAIAAGIVAAKSAKVALLLAALQQMSGWMSANVASMMCAESRQQGVGANCNAITKKSGQERACGAP